MKKSVIIYILLFAFSAFSKDQSIGKTNWELPNPNLRLDQMHFLGSHNAYLNTKSKWRYAQQEWSVMKQLDNGVRVLEIDIATQNGKLKICHGICTSKKFLKEIEAKIIKEGLFKPFKKVMENLSKWLQEHPNQILILILDSKRDSEMPLNKVDSELITLPKVNKMILRRADWSPEEHNGDWPTLQWMLDHGKRMVIFNPRTGDSPLFTFYAWRYIGGTMPGFTTPEQTSDAGLRNESRNAFDDLESLEIKEMIEEGKKVDPAALQNAAQERKKYQRFYMLNHTSAISTEGGKKMFKIQKALGLAGDKKKVEKIESKSIISDNKRSTIQQVIDRCKKSNIMYRKNPNIIFLDWTHKYILDDGLQQINEWNAQEAARLPKSLQF